MPRKRKKVDHFVDVRNIETRTIEQQFGPFGSRKMATRAETGIQRQLDTKTFFTHVTDRKHTP